MTSVAVCARITSPKSTKNPPAHWGVLAVKRLSTKNRSNAGSSRPVIAAMSVVIVTMTNTGRVPVSRCSAKFRIEAGLPPYSKSGPGSNIMHTPEYDLLNSSKVMMTFPRAGSLR